MEDQYARLRSVERIQLGIPIIATVNGQQVAMLDLSLHGCQIESHFPLKVRSIVTVGFDWARESLALRGEVVRCKFASGDDGVVYSSGVRFKPREGSEDHHKLRALIARQLERALDEQKLNARGELAEILEHMPIFNPGGTLTSNKRELAAAYEESVTSLPWTKIARQRGFVRCSLKDGKWSRVRTHDPAQPEEGVTVWAYEDTAELRKLLNVYQRADADTRKFIRICAELSLIVDDSLLPQRFSP